MSLTLPVATVALTKGDLERCLFQLEQEEPVVNDRRPRASECREIVRRGAMVALHLDECRNHETRIQRRA